MQLSTLSIRGLLIAYVVGSIMALLAVATLALWSIWAAEKSVERTQFSFNQLTLATELEAGISRLLVSEIRRIVQPGGETSFERQVDRVNASLDRLGLLVSREIDWLEDEDEKREELEEFQAVNAVHAQFKKLVDGLKREQGRTGGPDDGSALRGLFSHVVDVHYSKLNVILGSVVADERGEVSRAIASMQAFKDRIAYVVVLLVGGVSLLGLFGAFLVYRLLMRPLNDLTAGSAAIAAGDIDHRIHTSGPFEYANLARQFNEMAERISQHQHAQEDLNVQLEETVAQRTQELQEKSNALAEIDKSRRLFFAQVSHELRTPVTVMVGEAEVALKYKDAGAETYKEALQHIAANGQYLKRRIGDLLSVARSEDGQLELQRQLCALNPLVADTVQLADSFARSSGLRLKASIPAEPIIAEVDPDWLQQGILTLIDNAIKFSPSDGQVDISLTADAEGALIKIVDYGPGVPSSKLSNLFIPYFQAGKGRSHEGVGLGLTIARWVAEQHDGTISVANTEPTGLSIEMKIPVCR